MLEMDFVRVPRDSYIFRVTHRIMEGDCQMEHGPVLRQVGPIYAMKFAVTNGMYRRFLKDSGYRPRDPEGFLRHWQGGSFPAGEEDLPVVNVSREDAKAFAAFYGCRLPSEAEWQYLAGGPNKLRWPWGNLLERSFCNGEGGRLQPVDSHPEGVSPFGLYNMCGNCWEWVSDEFYDGDLQHRFTVLKGGCCWRGPDYWHADGGPQPNDSHLKMHLIGPAMDRCATVGFRCVKDGE